MCIRDSPYTSQYDADQMNNGWFVPSIPDLNQKNPHFYRYLVQNSFWWVEFANIDGIRMDTYPYADYDAMSNWMKELNEEYPLSLIHISFSDSGDVR